VLAAVQVAGASVSYVVDKPIISGTLHRFIITECRRVLYSLKNPLKAHPLAVSGLKIGR
jgi:hypothetical protein